MEFFEWLLSPFVITMLYLTGILISFSALYWSYTKGNFEEDWYDDNTSSILMLVGLSIIWPYTWVAHVEGSLWIEWDENTKLGRFGIKYIQPIVNKFRRNKNSDSKE